MELLLQFADLFIHLNHHLANLLADYGELIYVILFLIIFAETGLVIMPFLPGDSLLFATGALAASTGQLEIGLLIPLLIIAALLGDNTNYAVGKVLGTRIKSRENLLFLKKQHIEHTEGFYAKYGGRTVIMARFIPIVRTVAPFVAGAGNMNYFRYMGFCIAGAILWVGSLLLLGYQFGGLDIVKNNFDKVILGIIVLSFLPLLQQFIAAKRATAN